MKVTHTRKSWAAAASAKRAKGSGKGGAAKAWAAVAEKTGATGLKSTPVKRKAGAGTGAPKTLLARSTRSKYGAVKTNGYASKREAARAAELKLLDKAGLIRNLREQVTYELVPKQVGERALTYVADFVYDEGSLKQEHGRLMDAAFVQWKEVIEDVKGVKTPEYRIKRKLMKYLLNITIRET